VTAHRGGTPRAVSAVDDLFPPQTIVDQRYIILERMSRGGVGDVYRASHLHMGRTVALKVLRDTDPHIGDDVRRRFVGEAQIIAQLDHPNIVRVHDMGFAGSSLRPYIVMELLEGHDAARELEVGGPMAPWRAIPLWVELLSAVAEVHDQGFVHKDLKPSNLFLLRPTSRVERLVLLDFGVARRTLDTGHITRAGHFVGTCQYLAPEYIREQVVSPAFDVYQMGLSLVEMMTGRPVVEAIDVDSCLLKHCNGQLSIPDWLNEGALGELLRRALAVDPSARWEDGRAFRDALAGWCGSEEGRKVLQRREGVTGRAGAGARRTPVVPHRLTAAAAGRLEEPARAVEGLERPPSTVGADFDALFLAATQATLRRAYEDAVELFEACEALRPGDVRVSYNLGRLGQHRSTSE